MLRRLLGQASVGRYAIIGVSGILLDTLVFVGLTHAGLPPVLATIISTCCGILNNYLLNAHFNFGFAPNAVHLRRFFTVGLLGLGISAASLQLLITLGMEALPAKLVSLPVVITAQFLANKYWTFRPV
jgi:putative flippase GtrA